MKRDEPQENLCGPTAAIEFAGPKCQIHAMSMLADPLNLLFIAVAAIAGFKLWQVMGSRTGFHGAAPVPKIETASLPSDLDLKPSSEKPVWQGYSSEHEPLGEALSQIAARSRDFETDAFMRNAGQAHEHILEAFAKPDLEALKNLLTPDIYPVFETEVKRRQAQGESAFFKFVGIAKAELVNAHLTGSVAALEIRFVSQVFSAVKDRTGKTLVGDDKSMRTIKERWTFECDMSRPEKIWKLADTQDAA